MSNIDTYLQQILNGVYGRDIRQAIHDGIEQCYEDATSVDASEATAGQVLTADGSGGFSFQNPSGGSVPASVKQAIGTLLLSATYGITGLTDEKAVIEAWVNDIPTVSISPTSGSVQVGSVLTATVTVSGSASLSVNSTNTAVATASVINGHTLRIEGVGSGSATITVTYGEATATYNVSVTAELTSISAVYSGGTIYTNDTLDSLKNDLVVTATYSDSSTAVISASDYTLSGTIAEGTQTITVAYSGKTTTFTVTCAINGWLYRFDNSLLSSGTKDFGFTGTEGYGTGHDGTGQCYEYVSGGSMSPIVATGFTVPDLSGDFTISLWHKCVEDMKGQILSPFETTTDNTTINLSGSASNIKSGYTITKATSVKKSTAGIRFFYYQGKMTIRLVSADLTQGTAFDVTFPSSFDSTIWHHFAFTRKDGVFRFFVDGEVIFTFSTTISMLFADQLSVCGFFATVDSSVATSSYGASADDFFVAEYCKWDSDFDPSAIVY